MLSVVIPALNSESTIGLTLSSIFSNEFSRGLFEVLVVDDGSSDRTVEIAERFPVRVHHCSKRGIGPPRNVGIKMANGNIVCFTDSDCVVGRDWLQKIWGFFEQHPDADGVGGPVVPYAHGQNEIQRLTGELFVEDQRYPRKIKKVEFGSMNGMIFGSNSAYKRDAVVSGGGFSEPGGSNLELAWRLVSMKRSLFFDPDIRVSHIFPSDIRAVFREQFRWGMQATQMERAYHLDKGVEELVYVSYFLARRLLSLVSYRHVQKRLLQLFQLASYDLGRIYGFRR